MSKKKKSHALPIAAGVFILLTLAGFSLGLRTVIEFDPESAQIRTTKLILIYIPVSITTEPTWITPDPLPATQSWELTHEFHHSAAGSKIHHTHWGATVDNYTPWNEFPLDIPTKAHLADKTLSLINDDYNIKSKRVYTLRLNSQLAFIFAQPTPSLSIAEIDTLFAQAVVNPIDAEASMFPDP